MSGFHVKGQVIDARGLSAWGYGGQTTRARRLEAKGASSAEPGRPRANAWKKQTVRSASTSYPGTARHDPLGVPAEPHGRLARPPARRARAAGPRRIERTPLIVEHEYPPARVQERERCCPSCRARSPSRARSTRPPPACSRCSSEVLAVPGHPRAGRRPPGLPELRPPLGGPAHESDVAERVGMIGYQFMGRAHSERLAPGRRFFDTCRSSPCCRCSAAATPSRRRARLRSSGGQSTRPHGASVVARPTSTSIDICTPGDSHLEIALAAAEAGKAILCEKPLANTLSEAEQHARRRPSEAGVCTWCVTTTAARPPSALAKR